MYYRPSYISSIKQSFVKNLFDTNTLKLLLALQMGQFDLFDLEKHFLQYDK